MALLMKCGHVANAERVLEDGSRIPCCAICNGFKDGAEEVERECTGTDGLEGRKARCVYASPRPGDKCKGEVASNWELPFFEYRPSDSHDKYYCGCWGWD
jgi:hypothetical protein